MTTQFPGYTQAVEADEAARASDRPSWAQAEYNIEKGHGKVAKVVEGHRQTPNGNDITFYQLELANATIEKAAVPVTGTPALTVAAPNPGGRLGIRQPYYWTLEKVQPDIDNLGQLVGKDIDFELKARKPFESAKYDSYYYEITLGTASSNGHMAPTAERLDEAALQVVGLTHAQALDVLEDEGPQIMANLIRTKKVKQVEGVYQPV